MSRLKPKLNPSQPHNPIKSESESEKKIAPKIGLRESPKTRMSMSIVHVHFPARPRKFLRRGMSHHGGARAYNNSQKVGNLVGGDYGERYHQLSLVSIVVRGSSR